MCPHVCKRACRRVRLSVYLIICMYVCSYACVQTCFRQGSSWMQTDRCMRFDMYIRTNVRTNGPSNRHTDDCVLIHKMAYSAFIFIKEDFFLS